MVPFLPPPCAFQHGLLCIMLRHTRITVDRVARYTYCHYRKCLVVRRVLFCEREDLGTQHDV